MNGGSTMSLEHHEAAEAGSGWDLIQHDWGLRQCQAPGSGGRDAGRAQTVTARVWRVASAMFRCGQACGR
jgi:hypothetical protein